nr:extracellular protein 2-3 [Fulvia fulva]
MLYRSAAVVALLPTYGVATKFLAGSGKAQAIDASQLKQFGGDLGSPNLATTLMSAIGSGNVLPASNQDFPKGDSPQGNGNAGIADGVNDCGFSTFVQLNEDEGYAQASVDDCYALIDEIVNDQEWIITQELQTIVENGTCAFQAVVSKGQGDGLVGALGNADIIDLITDAIKQLGGDGYIGCHGGFGMYTSAAGAMPCDSPNLSDGEQVFVDWFLTSPGGIAGGESGSSDGGDGGSSYGGKSASSYGGKSASSYGGDGGSSDGGKSASSYGGKSASSYGGKSASSYGGDGGSNDGGDGGSSDGGKSASSYGGKTASSYGGDGGSSDGGKSAQSYGHDGSSSNSDDSDRRVASPSYYEDTATGYSDETADAY